VISHSHWLGQQQGVNCNKHSPFLLQTLYECLCVFVSSRSRLHLSLSLSFCCVCVSFDVGHLPLYPVTHDRSCSVRTSRVALMIIRRAWPCITAARKCSLSSGETGRGSVGGGGFRVQRLDAWLYLHSTAHVWEAAQFWPEAYNLRRMVTSDVFIDSWFVFNSRTGKSWLVHSAVCQWDSRSDRSLARLNTG